MQAVAHPDHLEIAVRAEKLALYVLLTATVPGRFSDGCFDLGPGECKNITFRPDDPADIASAQAGLQLYDLTSSHTLPTKDL